jgi:hypothetical protein
MGIKSRPLLYLRARSTPHIVESEYGLLPTPMAQSRETTPEQTIERQKKYGGKTRAMYLENFAVMGMLPTPQASDFVSTVQTNNYSLRHIEHQTGWAKRLLPTPTAGEHKANKTYDKRYQAKSGLTAMAANGMLPTPTASDQYNGTPILSENYPRETDLKHYISQQIGKASQLSPRFVAEMMGFPSNWTELPFQSGETKV